MMGNLNFLISDCYDELTYLHFSCTNGHIGIKATSNNRLSNVEKIVKVGELS